MWNMTKRIGLILMFSILAFQMAGCTSSQKEPPDQVSVQLKWVHSVQFAGMYLAEQKGFYADENIAVTFNTGSPKVDKIESVTSGRDDFGIVSAPEVLQARATGAEIKAIAVIFRVNPSVYFAMADSGIETPEDFVGKKVRRNPRDFVLPAMMSNLGIDMDQLQAAPPDLDMEAFFSGEVDVWLGYLTNQVIAARSKGYKLNIFYPDNYGEHTELVMEAQVPLIHTGVDDIGYMRGEVWEEMYQLMFNHGILEAPLDPETVYTMEFLNKVYEVDQ